MIVVDKYVLNTHFNSRIPYAYIYFDILSTTFMISSSFTLSCLIPVVFVFCYHSIWNTQQPLYKQGTNLLISTYTISRALKYSISRVILSLQLILSPSRTGQMSSPNSIKTHDNVLKREWSKSLTLSHMI